jgi:hypothetical protein
MNRDKPGYGIELNPDVAKAQVGAGRNLVGEPFNNLED